MPLGCTFPAKTQLAKTQPSETEKEVGDTGLEPVTSCMSSKHSKPTELIALELSELLIITKR